MPARLLTGTELADSILEGLRKDVKELDPHLVIVQVGDNPESTVYIEKKLKACEKIGMTATHLHLPENVSFEKLIEDVEKLNLEPDISGILLQLPLPGKLKDRTPEVLRVLDPKKDVDGLTARNLGKTLISKEYEHLAPATPAGVIRLLEHYKIPLQGINAVVVGSSDLVGKPLAMMLLNRGATVTICNIHTKDLASHTRQADLLCTAVGKPNLITGDMVKPGAVVIDIGTTREKDVLKGDLDFEAVFQIASAVTPVPGGVGPMTVASLLQNCVTAKKRQVSANG